MAKNPNYPSSSKGKQVAAVQDEGNDDSNAETSAGNLDRIGKNARAQERSEETKHYELWYPLWSDAIKDKHSSELLRLLTVNGGEHLWKYETRGRTALHVAAIQGDRHLAESILDQLWKVRQESYTVHSWPSLKQFFQLGDYIEAVDDSSGKTALELAKNVTHENSKAICDYIEVILRRSEAHNVVDQAVHTFGYDFMLLRNEATVPMNLTEGWIRGIRNRDCTILLKVLEYHRTPSTSSQQWMCEHLSDRSGSHVAAMQGCFSLAREILDKAKEENNRDYIEAVDLESGLTALQMADDIIGNRSIAEYIKFTLQLLKKKEYVHPCFFDAYPRSLWCIALSTGDSPILEHLLSINSRLGLETYKGLTVLQWAIIWNAKDLVRIILDYLLGDRKNVEWGEYSYFPPKFTWKHMLEKEISSGDYDLQQMNRSNSAFEALVKDQPFKLKVPVKDRTFIDSAIQLAGLVKLDYSGHSDIEKELIRYQERECLLRKFSDQITMSKEEYPVRLLSLKIICCTILSCWILDYQIRTTMITDMIQQEMMIMLYLSYFIKLPQF